MEDYVLYKDVWIRKGHLAISRRLSDKVCLDLLKNGGKIVRNIYNWDKPDESQFWYVIKDRFVGMDELPTKVRNQVRKSLKTYCFRIVSYNEFLECGCKLYNKSRERFGAVEVDQAWWERRISDDSLEFWVGYDVLTNLPASFAINTVYDDYVDYSTMGISPDFPNNTYPMYGLIYEMNRYYLEKRAVPFVCDGSRSVMEHSNIQNVLEEKFKFRRAYCDLQIFYCWWLRIAVKLLYPFRRWIHHRKVSVLLKQESWARG